MGMPEVIFGKGKTPEQVAGIAARLLDRASNVLATRSARAAFELVQEEFPEAEYFPLSGALRVWRDRTMLGKGNIVVMSAGTDGSAGGRGGAWSPPK